MLARLVMVLARLVMTLTRLSRQLLRIGIFFLTVLLRSKLFLSFFLPLGLSPPGLSTDFRPSVWLPPGLVFNVISTIPTFNIGGYCRLGIRKVAVTFLKSLLVPPFIVNL
jgi:hypothetical protein